jgi:hypothetical protein
MTNAEDFREALYVYSLDYERLDVIRRLLDCGFSPRPSLANQLDLTANGASIYDGLSRLFALLDDKKPAITVTRRCQDVASKRHEPILGTLKPSGSTQVARVNYFALAPIGAHNEA